MICPKCKSDNLKIIDTRPSGGITRRRRICLDCNVRLSTLEVLEYEYKNLKGKEKLLNIMQKKLIAN